MSKAINIKLNLIDDKQFESSKLKNKTILFFYPKALTSGCSIEVSDYQRMLSVFKN